MPKLKVTVDALVTIANHVYKGEIKTLNIKRYKTGKNAGELFAEYTVDEKALFTVAGLEKRQQVADLLRQAAIALSDNRLLGLLVSKQEDTYTHRLEIRGAKAT